MRRRPDEGRLVTRTFGHDGGRTVAAWVPAAPVEAVVFAGDGDLLAPWGQDLEGDGLPATLVVGVHRHPDETTRLHEYSPGFDPDRFAAHERFLLDEVRAWTTDELGGDLPRERTAVWGVSAGAELALALGLRHPSVFGAVLAASPGAGFTPPPELSATPPTPAPGPAPGPAPTPLAPALPRVYLVAGTQEPFFLDNATRWSTALQAAGADVVLHERPGGHGDAFWRQELPSMVGWAFGG